MALDRLGDGRRSGIMIQPWLYSLVLHTLCDIEEFDEMLELIKRHNNPEDFISPIQWLEMLDCASHALHYDLTAFIFERRIQTQYTNPSVGICTNIMYTAARHGDVRIAVSTFQSLSSRSGCAVQRHHYEALVDTYIANNDLKSALSVLSTMEAARLGMDLVYARAFARAICRIPDQVSEGDFYIAELRNEGRLVPILAMNAIREASGSIQQLKAAAELEALRRSRARGYGSTSSPNATSSQPVGDRSRSVERALSGDKRYHGWYD